jgi:hypothetical protein
MPEIDRSEKNRFPLQHLFEFSLHYGLLRLSAEMRQSLNVETLVVQVVHPHKFIFSFFIL